MDILNSLVENSRMIEDAEDAFESISNYNSVTGFNLQEESKEMSLLEVRNGHRANGYLPKI